MPRLKPVVPTSKNIVHDGLIIEYIYYISINPSHILSKQICCKTVISYVVKVDLQSIVVSEA